MAGVKVTDLNALGSADANDVFYIVDTSANESKKIEVGSLFESGTWTPAFSSFTGAITSATLTSATYSKVGNIVTCAIYLSITYDFSSLAAGDFEFTYPFAPTTINGNGSLSSSGISKQFNGSVRNNLITMASVDTSLVSTDTFHAIFQYEIN